MSKATENVKKYLQAPSLEDIENFMKRKKIRKASSLEHFYGIPKGTIKQIRWGKGSRCLPAKFWHIFYEDAVPAYGVGFLQKDLTVSHNPPINKGEILKNVFSKKVTKNVVEHKEITEITDKLAELLGD